MIADLRPYRDSKECGTASARARNAELAMLAAFKKQKGQKPFANFDRKHGPERIRLLAFVTSIGTDRH